MPKKKQIGCKDSETHLKNFGLMHKGFEHYESDSFTVKGLKDSDYRWQVIDKRTGEFLDCSSLIECVRFIERQMLPTPNPAA